MSLIIIVGIIWAICKLISAASAASKERARQAEMARVRAAQERQRAEQARMREEWKRAQAEARAEAQRVVALEREQMRQAKELEKHEAMLRKHDEQIAKLQFKVRQSETDIERLTDRISKLYARLDIAQNQQMMAVPGSKADDTAQSKIISLERQIDNAEKQLEKAKFDKDMAERKLA